MTRRAFIALAPMSCVAGPMMFGQNGAGWVPTQLGSTLKEWFDPYALTGLANSDPISTLADSSGNSHTATQSGATRPTYNTSGINSKPAASFSGSQYFNLASPAAITGDLTLFGVVNRATSNQLWFTGSASGYIGMYSDNKVYFAEDTGSAVSVSFTVNGNTIVQLKRASGVVSVRTSKGGSWTTVGTKTGNITPTYFGHTGFGGLSTNGAHGDMIICDTVLGSTNDDLTWDYLKAKWNL